MKPYYDDGRGIVLYHGDMRDLLPRLPEVDHMITDPPYSSQSHAMHDSGKAWATSQDGLERQKIGFDSISIADLMWVLLVARVRRWAVFTMDDMLTAALRAFGPPTGWKYVRTGIWVKPGSMPQFTGDRPAMGYEPIPMLHRSRGRMRWNGGGRSCVWTETPCHGEHPTEKPIALYRSLIAAFTDPNETVLDPFMGSGTTARACKDLGRRFVGVEISERFCEVAARRLDQEVLL